ncbi:protein cramped [Neocloeon triangulifer]|uniref:protein cramped n=1 Tax=Neocloeon triangulifer TaxID=2078957 RepID=UPI00286F6447|nr:protein cramped [Neocloeon triangulifer]
MEKTGQQIRECLHNHDLRSLDSAMVQEGAVPSNAVEPSNSTKPTPVRSSARVSKKAKLDLQTKTAKDEKGKSAIVSGPSNLSATEGKRKRNWGLWSVEDKNIFFEALNEFGKDFDAIQNHFASKIKKRGVTEAKNKDQVRHFYYRNWHKISKFINFNPDLGKVNQELFGLINYGELRKRLGRSVLDKNVILKLHELIYDGTTQIKVKGKTVRVKTPPCRALRKLGQNETGGEGCPKLPQRVGVELRPLNNRTWGIVHVKAYNPRVSTNQPLQHKLSSLITLLQNRWQSRDSKLLEKLAAAGEANVPPPRQTMRLRLAPKAGVKISVPSLNVNDSTSTNSAISLKSLEGRLISMRKSASSRNGKSGAKGRSKKKVADGDKTSELQDSVGTDKLVALQLEGDDATDGDLKKSPREECGEEGAEERRFESHAAQLETIKAGWTADNAGNITLGELYVMFGSNSKLCFEYSWEEIPPIAAVNGVDRIDAFSSVIKRLVNLAKLLPVLKEKPSCPCGHICTKGTAKGRQRVAKPKAAATAASMVTPKEEAFVHGAMLQATAVVIPKVFPHSTSMTIQPVPAQDAMFRRPLLAPSQAKSQQDAEDALKASLEQFRSKKYCNRVGRTSRKNMAVQRVVSTLLPKVPDGLVAIVPQNVVGFASPGHGVVVPVIQGPTLTSPKVRTSPIAQPVKAVPLVAGTAVKEISFKAKSPTISSLLGLNPDDLSLGAENATLKDVTLGNNDPPSFVGLLGQTPTDVPEPSAAEISPPLSPTQILKESADNQWLNSEVSDFSLSSFLGHLESPLKSSVHGTNNEDSRMSQDVDAQFQSLITENSLEFMTSFADLAAHIAPEPMESSRK